jgi:pimeloyl-ACP methyl ester carboxylesterase
MKQPDQFVQANNIRLHYLDHRSDHPSGAGGGPILILLPGLTANARCFDGLVRAGLSQRLRVLALDLRGRGLSDKPATGYSMADHAADVIALLDALKIERAVIGGHSFGGLLTFYLAANFSERVSKLVVIDAAVKLVNSQTRELIKPSLDRLGQRSPSWQSYIEAIKRAPYFDGWWDQAIESYFRADVQFNEDGGVQPRSRPENIAEAMDRAQREDWDRHLAAIKQPALLLCAHGSYGAAGAPPIVSPEQARATAAALADCRLVETSGNHFTMLYGAGAQRIVESIVEFVNEG